MATNRTAQVIEHLRKAALLQEARGLTDGQLLGCFIDHRDAAAFAAILKRHGPMVQGQRVLWVILAIWALGPWAAFWYTFSL